MQIVYHPTVARNLYGGSAKAWPVLHCDCVYYIRRRVWIGGLTADRHCKASHRHLSCLFSWLDTVSISCSVFIKQWTVRADCRQGRWKWGGKWVLGWKRTPPYSVTGYIQLQRELRIAYFSRSSTKPVNHPTPTISDAALLWIVIRHTVKRYRDLLEDIVFAVFPFYPEIFEKMIPFFTKFSLQ